MLSSARNYIIKHTTIISALMLRELATRYGRNNIGFLWIIGEPLIFSVGVFMLWSLIRAPYEHGIKLMPFLITGYFPLLMIRHSIGHAMNCVAANANLLYHRSITLLHLFVARTFIEIAGVTLAFIIVLAGCIIIGLVDFPKSMMTLYGGWCLLAWLTFGITLVFGGVAAIYDIFEKIGNLISYVMIPISGAYFMVFWIPYQYRELALKIPFVNCVEMIRRGFFGEFEPTYYHVGYVIEWSVISTLIGLIALKIAREKIEVE